MDVFVSFVIVCNNGFNHYNYYVKSKPTTQTHMRTVKGVYFLIINFVMILNDKTNE